MAKEACAGVSLAGDGHSAEGAGSVMVLVVLEADELEDLRQTVWVCALVLARCVSRVVSSSVDAAAAPQAMVVDAWPGYGIGR